MGMAAGRPRGMESKDRADSACRPASDSRLFAQDRRPEKPGRQTLSLVRRRLLCGAAARKDLPAPPSAEGRTPLRSWPELQAGNPPRPVLGLHMDHYGGEDNGRTHAPVPFYVSDKGYGVLVNSAEYITVYAGTGTRVETKHPPMV